MNHLNYMRLHDRLDDDPRQYWENTSNGKIRLDPVATTPPSDQHGAAQRCLQTQQIETLLSGLVHHHHRHRAIGGALGLEAHIAHSRFPRVVPPGPLALEQVVSFDLSPIG